MLGQKNGGDKMQTTEIKKKKAGNEKVHTYDKEPPAIDKKKWQKPCLEDVSGKIMAQPYIRFT